jgi:hypothetical protein
MKPKTLHERLRDVANKLRTKPIPLSDLIPILHEAADELEELDKYVQELYDR